jgi:hypothetical protein
MAAEAGAGCYPLLRVLNWAVDARGPKSDGPRVLLSLFVMDTLSWVCYKAIQWEAVKQARLAHVSGTSSISPMIFALILATVETSMKFVMSAMTPHVYRWVEGAEGFATGPLAVFTTRAYTISLLAAGVIALLATPCMWAESVDGSECDCTVNATAAAIAEEAGICAAIGKPIGNCPLAPAALSWLYAFAYTIFYSGCNQLGDSSREMGRTLWLDAFQDMTLSFPGVGCAAIRRKASSARSISTFLAFLRMFYPATGALIIFLAANEGVMLWSFVLFSATLGAGHGLSVAPPGKCGEHRCAYLVKTLTDHDKAADHADDTAPARAEFALPDGASAASLGAAAAPAHLPSGEPSADRAVLLRVCQLYQREVGLVLFLVIARIPNLVATNITAYLTGDALILDTIAAVPQLSGMRARLGYAAIGAAITITALGYVVSLMANLPKDPDPQAAADSPAREGKQDAAKPDPAVKKGKAKHCPLDKLSKATHCPLEMLSHKLGKSPHCSTDEPPMKPHPPPRGASSFVSEPPPPRAAKFRRWLFRLWVMMTCVLTCGILLLMPSTGIGQSAWARLGFTWAAIAAFLPYVVPFKPMVDVMLDAFMLRYDDDRSASLVYYTSLLEVCFAWCLLGLTAIFTSNYGDFVPESSTNCTAAELAAAALPPDAAPGGRSIAELEASRERGELSALLLMTGGMMLLASVYFTLLDNWLLTPRRALSALVNLVAKEAAADPEKAKPQKPESVRPVRQGPVRQASGEAGHGAAEPDRGGDY